MTAPTPPAAAEALIECAAGGHRYNRYSDGDLCNRCGYRIPTDINDEAEAILFSRGLSLPSWLVLRDRIAEALAAAKAEGERAGAERVRDAAALAAMSIASKAAERMNAPDNDDAEATGHRMAYSAAVAIEMAIRKLPLSPPQPEPEVKP